MRWPEKEKKKKNVAIAPLVSIVEVSVLRRRIHRLETELRNGFKIDVPTTRSA